MHDRAADEPVSAAEAAALFGALSGFPVLVLAVSGGPDSTALMWLAARWRDGVEHPPKLIAVTVDHGLRKESAREALAVKQLARELKVEHRTLRWTGKKPETGIQATARKARYRLLSAAAQRAGARHILTAHTLDDQAETILFRLARGSGISGLRGMAPLAPLPACGERSARAAGRRTLGRSARLDSPPYPDLRPACQEREPAIVRPLLRIPKSRLLATLAVAKIPFSDDPSNRDPRFTRPRLRELMPALAAEGLDAARLAALGRRMARADQAIERAADDAMKAHARGIAKSVVFGPGHADLPPEVALRLLHRAIEQVGNEGPVELGKLEALYQALDAARGSPGRFRRTLAGAMITLSGTKLTVEPTPSRRIGAKTRASGPKAAFTKPR